MTSPSEKHFGLFLSSVEGYLVRRHGTAELIGAQPRGPSDTGPVWTPELIVPITHAEAARYGHEYRRAQKEGGLRFRTVEEYDAQLEAHAQADKDAIAKAEADAKQAKADAEAEAAKVKAETERLAAEAKAKIAAAPKTSTSKKNEP